MSCPIAASRHRAYLRAFLASSCLLPIASLAALPANAQQGPVAMLPTITVTASRLLDGIVGTSTSVISAEDIAHSPAQSLPEIIAQTPGVQLSSLYGGTGGAGSNIDLRGFGAFATANTLVLINGRRLNDLDLAGVDLSTIPRDAVERIEITRGNSGAVLYGDNAVGGVVNIVTKTGASGPPVAMRVEGGVGSFNQKQGTISTSAHAGPWSTSFTGNMLKSDGYRDHNALDQRNGIGELRYATPDFSAFVNLSADNQNLQLPGGRLVDPTQGINELATARRGTSTPYNYADKQGVNVTTGFTTTLWDGGELIVDGGLRDKDQQAAFFGATPAIPFGYTDSTLRTWSITPRLAIKNAVFGLPSNVLTGIDYYDATYHSERPQNRGAPPLHVFDLSQQTLAGYWQQTVGLLPSTDVSYGARVQRSSLSARDRVDALAPGYFGDLPSTPLDSAETQQALHLGLEHRFNQVFTVFGRAASAFRTPNVDERVASGPAFDANFNPLAGNFRLKTQTSHDLEAGVRVKSGGFALQSSIYTMDLKNEIHYDPVNFYNTNLDPTRRSGAETNASLRVSDDVLLRAGGAITRAEFREGVNAGHDVPLVSRFSGNAGVTWNLWQNYLVLDATLRAWSSRRMDNDQRNLQPTIPGNATVDLKISGEIERFFWSLSVNNLLNADYYDYAVASPTTLGRFNAYPLAGRTYLVKAGATF